MSDDIDQVLTTYFRNEMPARFPPAPGSADETRVVVNGSWGMVPSRVLIGFSLVAMLAAYLGLATFFPKGQSNGLNPNASPIIGHRPGIEASKTAPK